MSATAAFAPDLRSAPRERWAAMLTEHYRSGLPGLLDIKVLDVGILHAGTLVAFADSFARRRASRRPGR
jgi:hypothetical protein